MAPKEFRAARLRLGLTQAQLAGALGYHGGKTVVYRKEAGLRPIHERDVLALECLERRAKK